MYCYLLVARQIPITPDSMVKTGRYILTLKGLPRKQAQKDELVGLKQIVQTGITVIKRPLAQLDRA